MYPEAGIAALDEASDEKHRTDDDRKPPTPIHAIPTALEMSVPHHVCAHRSTSAFGPLHPVPGSVAIRRPTRTRATPAAISRNGILRES
jgi:hypothetical protein